MKKDKSPIKLREKKLKNGNKSLYLDTYENGKRTFEFLKLYIIPERTPIDKERNRITYQQAETHRARRIIEKQNGKYGNVSNKYNKMMLTDMIDIKASTLKQATAENYKLLKTHVLRHSDILLNKVNKDYILSFIDYVNSTDTKPNTKRFYYGMLCATLNKAVRQGLLSTNPCLTLESEDKPKTVTSDVTYLTWEELNTMQQAKCNNTEVKRAFLFACFTGLRFSDLQKLTYANIIPSPEGGWRIEKKQKKTSDNVYIPLSKNAMKYLTQDNTIDLSTQKVTERVFNLPNKRITSTNIHKWKREANVTKHITFHSSRHTCATLLLTYGADLYTVSKILGHRNISTTQIYAEVIDRKRVEAVNNIPPL